MRTRWPRTAGDPRRRLFPSQPGLLPNDVPDGQAASLWVVPNWDGFSLARAARYYYWTATSDVGGAVVPEESTLSPTLVRLPFRGLGRNPYLLHRDYDSAPAVQAEPDTFVALQVRLPFKGLGRSAYLQHHDYDSAPVTTEESTFGPFLVRLPFRGLGRNPYLWRTAQDDSVVVVQDAPFGPLLVRIPVRRLGRNPYLLNPSRDIESAAVGDGGSNLVVVPNWDGYRLARASRFLYWTPVQGEDAPPIIVTLRLRTLMGLGL